MLNFSLCASLFLHLCLVVAFLIFSISLHLAPSPMLIEFCFPLFLRSAQHWMQCTAPSACWLPVHQGCRWSAVRQHPRSLGPLQWTTNSSLSRSSSAPTTSLRPLSNWSPSPLVRRNSDPTNAWMDGWRGKTEREQISAWVG